MIMNDSMIVEMFHVMNMFVMPLACHILQEFIAMFVPMMMTMSMEMSMVMSMVVNIVMTMVMTMNKMDVSMSPPHFISLTENGCSQSIVRVYKSLCIHVAETLKTLSCQDRVMHVMMIAVMMHCMVNMMHTMVVNNMELVVCDGDCPGKCTSTDYSAMTDTGTQSKMTLQTILDVETSGQWNCGEFSFSKVVLPYESTN